MTVTGMAWHLLLPCHTERGEPGSRPFPNSCPDLRKADCSLLRLKFRVAEALLPPCSETLAGPRAASPVWGWERVAHCCPGEAAMPSGQSSGFRVFLSLGLASGLRARPNICPLFQWALSLLHSPVPVSLMGVIAVPCPVLGVRVSPR